MATKPRASVEEAGKYECSEKVARAPGTEDELPAPDERFPCESETSGDAEGASETEEAKFGDELQKAATGGPDSTADPCAMGTT